MYSASLKPILLVSVGFRSFDREFSKSDKLPHIFRGRREFPEMQSKLRFGRSLLALFAGFVAVVVLSLGTDWLLRVLGVFPALGHAVSDERLFLLPAMYRSVYGVLGGYVTARLAPYRALMHAMAGGVFGFFISILGVVAAWNNGPEFGPHWYPISLVITALPCAWLGGWLGGKPSAKPA